MLSPSSIHIIKGNPNNVASAIKKPTNKIPREPFPEKLMGILNDEQNHAAIRWCEGGGTFIVVDKDKFMAEVVPRT
jgi:hypothetical protein